MLRPSQGSILGSSRAAQRRTARAARARAASGVARLGAAVVIELLAGLFELALLVGLPIAYAAASFLVLALPLRVFSGGAPFTLMGTLAFLGALAVSTVGILRAAQGQEPIAPVRRGFARALLALNWAAAIVLALTDL